MKCLIVDNSVQEYPESMGIFGLSWPEKVASDMLNGLRGTGYESTVKAFWGAGGKNTKLIKNLQSVYERFMIEGNEPPTFTGGETNTYATYLSGLLSAETATPEIVTLQFLKSLYNLTQKGDIDYKLYNPVGYSQSAEVVKASKPKSGIEAVATETGKVLNRVLIVAGIGAAAYLLSNVKNLLKG